MERSRRSDEGLSPRAWLLLITSCHFLAALAVIELSILSGGFVGVWIANAVSTALMIRGRAASLPALVLIGLASFGANALVGVTPTVNLVYTVCGLLQIAVAVKLLRRTRDWSSLPPDPPEFVRGVMIAAGLAPAAAAAVFAFLAVAVVGRTPADSLIMWLVSNALGAVLLFPPLMLASRARTSAIWREGRTRQLVIAVVSCSAIAATAAVQIEAPFLIVLIPMLAAAIYLPSFEITLITAVTGVTFIGVAILGALQGHDSNLFRAGFQVPAAISLTLPCLASVLMEAIRRRQRQLSDSEERFRRAMQDAAIGMAIVDLSGRITHANRSFADMLGYAPAELEGKTVAEITHPLDLAEGIETVRRAAAGAIDSYRAEKRYLHKDGSAVWTRLSGSVMRSAPGGRPLYMFSQIENIDASKRADLAVSEAENRWTFALASAGQGVWDTNFATGETFYSEVWMRMLGYGDDEIGAEIGGWLSLIHPDDRERVRSIDLDHIEGRTDHFEAEFRIRHKDGRWIWVLDRGRALERDADGRVLRAIGTYTDITRQKEAEARIAESAAALRREKERLRVTLQSIGDAVICTDGEDRVTFMNPIAEKLTGFCFAEADGMPLEAIYAPVDEETGDRIEFSGKRARMTCGYTGRAALIRRDGFRCSIREVISPIASDSADPAGRVIVFQDYTDARTMQRELAHAATHDALTGLSNRSALLSAMARTIEEARLHGTVSQLLFVDLDRFKNVNDSSGHAAGDAMLRRVGQALVGQLRAGDLAARLGGDEFAVILKGCGAKEADRIAHAVREAVASMGLVWDGIEHRVGASVGIAAIDWKAVSPDEVVARADRACYQAKAVGRGAVAHAGPAEEERAAFAAA